MLRLLRQREEAPRPPMRPATAAHKLLMIGFPAFCKLVRWHVLLRKAENDINPHLLRDLAHYLDRLADDVEREATEQESSK